MIIHNPILTGSFTVNGTDVASITSSAASITAINAYTASQNILNGTYTLTSSFAAQTASFTAFTSSVNSFTASQLVLNGTYATTSSNTFAGVQTINSNLIVTGSITAQTLVVQTVTSSVSFITGSTKFGSLSSNTHVFTGSMSVSGSGAFVGIVGVGGATEAGWSLKSNGNLKVENSNGTTVLQVNDTSTGGKTWSLISAGAGNAHSVAAGTFYLRNSSDSSTAFTISSTGAATFSGSVGVGNITPYSILSLPSGTGWNGGLSWNYTTANSSSKRWWINTDQIAYGDFRICVEQTQGGGTISNASTLYERLYISNSGSVVLGLTSDFIGERLRVGGSTSANKPAIAITSANPNVSCPSGTATTVYTFPSYPRVMFYMVFVRFDTGADANGYAAYAVVAASSAGSKLMTVVNGIYVTLTLSGLNVQINQTSGATQNAVVSVIQIFANGGSD